MMVIPPEKATQPLWQGVDLMKHVSAYPQG